MKGQTEKRGIDRKGNEGTAEKRALGKRFRAGLWILSGVLLLSFAGPVCSGYTFDSQRIEEQGMAPRIPGVEYLGIFDGRETIRLPGAREKRNRYEDLGLSNRYYWLGSDGLGRDIFTRTCMGIRISLAVALLAVGADVIVGIAYGMISGYFGGRIDLFMQRVTEIINGIPNLVIAMVLLLLLRPGFLAVSLSISLTGWIRVSRTARAMVLEIKEKEFVIAAKTQGAGSFYILRREIFPNMAGTMLAVSLLAVPEAVFTEAFLAFIGLGIPAPYASLGTLISDGFQVFTIHPYMVIPPAIALLALMLGFNLTADGMKNMQVQRRQGIREEAVKRQGEKKQEEKKIGEEKQKERKYEEDTFFQVMDLSVCFPLEEGMEETVKDVAFAVKRGEMVALIGESGAGKTTLLQASLGLLDKKAQVKGQVFMTFDDLGEKRDILAMTRKERQKLVYGKKAVMAFQDPAVCLNPVLTIGKQMEEKTRFPFDRKEQLLLEAGLEEPERILKSFPHQLSGGQRQRVAILLSLLSEPDLFICDEPSASLDSLTRRQVFKMIEKERQRRNMAVLYVTHDLKFALGEVDRILVFHEGEMIEQGTPEKIFRNPEQEYTKKLLRAAGRLQEGDFASQEDQKAEKVEKPVLEAEELRQHFRKTKSSRVKAVDGVSFQIYPGEIYGLVGSSGAGKSTIGRAIMHVYDRTEGRLIIGGRDYSGQLNRKKRQELYQQVQMIFQDAAACLNPSRRVIDIVAQALDIRQERLGREEKSQKVLKGLEAVGLSKEILYRFPSQLSGGQRQRVGIARAIIGEPKILIVDEAVSALDPVMQIQVGDLLKEIQEKTGMAILFISHDLPVVRSICTRVGVLQNGKLLEEGTTEEVFLHPIHEYTKRLLEKEADEHSI
ncbi:ATP-binding cassette domain-containing protein [Lachnospiraceae bacterium 62-35]